MGYKIKKIFDGWIVETWEEEGVIKGLFRFVDRLDKKEYSGEIEITKIWPENERKYFDLGRYFTLTIRNRPFFKFYKGRKYTKRKINRAYRHIKKYFPDLSEKQKIINKVFGNRKKEEGKEKK